MDRKSLRAALAIALLGAFATAAVAQDKPAAPAGPQPKLEIAERTFNAGDVPKGDSVSHDYVVKNTGDADLLIMNVRPSCGCTTPGFDKVIPPGGTGKISLKVDTARFKGPISKSANVTTNDPTQPSLRLVISANVQTYIDVLPRDVVSFRQYRGEEKKSELKVKSNEKGEFKIQDVKVSGEHIEHSLTPDAEGGYDLAVWVAKDAPVGNMNGTVTLVTNSAKESEVKVTVRGTVLGQISVNPSTLYFRIDGRKQALTASTANLNVRASGDTTSDVVGKVNPGDKLEVLRAGGEWTNVRLPNGKTGWVFNKLVKPLDGGGVEQTKVLNITHRRESAFKITGSEVQGQKIDAGSLKVDTEAVREGQSYRVTVTYSGDLEKGNYTGSLVLSTSDKEEPEVKVPLYIVVT